jgi:V/A-type H+-transporting ATPase subunit D
VQRVSATRTELLASRTQIGLALQGRDLLEDKRQILVRELTQLAERGLKGASGVELVDVVKQPVARPVTRRGYSLAATSSRVDRIAERHERLLDELLDAVGVELSMRRLAEEIQRTARRVNALEHVVIPRLEDERRYIALVLDEREREDRTRLRRAKAR